MSWPEFAAAGPSLFICINGSAIRVAAVAGTIIWGMPAELLKINSTLFVIIPDVFELTKRVMSIEPPVPGRTLPINQTLFPISGTGTAPM